MSWSDRIEGMKGPRGIGAVLHIGAGRAEDLPAWRKSGATSIILVEPDPGVLPTLQKAAKGDSRIQVLPAAIAAQTGRAILHRLNLPGAASLRDPAGLSAHFPGLRIVEEPEVATLSGADLLAQIELSEDRSNVLILEAAGEEAAIIDDLSSAGALKKFGHVLLRMAAEPLYPRSASAAALVERFAAQGFSIAYEDRSDPDFPVLQFRCEADDLFSKIVAERDALDIKAAGLRVQLAAAATQIEELAAENKILRDQVRGQQSEIEAKAGQLSEIKVARHALWKERDAAREQRDTANQKIEALQKRVQELEFRAGLAREELHRSEDQIAVIKDLVLREGSL